jgi:hypothetical protein
MALLPEHLPGERLLIKIWQTVTERGIGGLLNPWQMRREGKARADVHRVEMQNLAQGYRDQLDILAGRKKLDDRGRLIECKPAEPPNVPASDSRSATDPNQAVPLLERLRKEQDRRLLERAINVTATIAMAEDEASSVADENVSDKPVDPDWFARWRVNAEEIQDDEMRRLWARILTGETAKPGRFSLHTLDFMRRLAKEDAALIEKVAPFVCGREVIRHDLLASNGIDLHALMELQDLGVMSGVEAQLAKTWTDSQIILRYWNKALLARSTEVKTLMLPIYGVTKVGGQVMSLGKFQANNEYILAIGQVILDMGFEVWLGDIRDLPDNQFEIYDAQRLVRPTASGA